MPQAPGEAETTRAGQTAAQNEPTDVQTPERRRGIYLLPNFLTTCAMFAGYFAIVSSINKHWEVACIAVFVAAFFDGIDGRVARLTNTQSAFGVQYDSLSDLVSFGLAPSLIMYNWSLASLKDVSPLFGKLGWLAAFVYAACAALRLARFNVQVSVQDKRFFQGLASPAAAGMMVSFVWAVQKLGGDGAGVRWLTPFLTITVALAMVSNLRYFSFKSWPEKVPFIWAIATLLLIVAIALEPPLALVGIFFAYVLSGPIMTFLGMRQHRAQLHARHPSVKADPVAQDAEAGSKKSDAGGEAGKTDASPAQGRDSDP
jgi:CDP-diacylglycerol---serine O-phosphatidyltransferase